MHPDITCTRKTSSEAHLNCCTGTRTSTCNTSTSSTILFSQILFGSTSTSIDDTLPYLVPNTGREMASALLEAAINKHKNNNPEAMKKRKERLQLATSIKPTSGATFLTL